MEKTITEFIECPKNDKLISIAINEFTYKVKCFTKPNKFAKVFIEANIFDGKIGTIRVCEEKTIK
jgi:hypothetical protein